MGAHLGADEGQEECDGSPGGQRVPGTGLEAWIGGDFGMRKPPFFTSPGHSQGALKKWEIRSMGIQNAFLKADCAPRAPAEIARPAV